MRFCLLCLWLLSVAANAQTLWLDSDWHIVDKTSATLYMDAADHTNADGVWPVSVYHKDTKRLMFKGFLPDFDHGEFIVGHFTYYHKNGQLRAVGQADSRSKTYGELRLYDFSGILTSINQLNNDEFDGLQQDLWPDGSVKRVFTLKMGQRNGVDKYFNEAGKLKDITHYVDDKKEGQYQYFDDDGKLTYQANYHAGKLDGVSERYNEKGELTARTHYKNGQREGQSIQYHYDRSYVTQEYKNDELDGVEISYFNNGVKKLATEYRHGELNGKRTFWNREGQISVQQTYVDGEKNGPYLNYYAGKLTDKGQYKNDRKVGTWYRYSTHSGQLTREEHYNADGKLDGVQKEYFDGNKQLQRETTYQHGQIITAVHYDQQGRIAREIYNEYADHKPLTRDTKIYREGKLAQREQENFTQDTRLVEEFDERGKVIAHMSYRNNRRDGDFVLRDTSLHGDTVYVTKGHFDNGLLNGAYQQVQLPEGIVIEQGQYQRSDKVGEWHFRRKESKRVEHFDNDGKRHGEFLQTTLDGQLLRKQFYRHGRKHGPYEEHDENGELDAKGNYVDDERDGAWVYRDGYGNAEFWRGQYHQGDKVGQWEARTKDGYLIARQQYDQQGRPTGAFYRFAPNGALQHLRRFVDGQRHGISASYVHGKLYHKELWQHGKLLSEESHDDVL